MVTDQLVQGYGPSLVKQVKESSPDIKCLMVLRRVTAEVVEESLEAGCQGICFQGNIGNGDKDFMKALQAIADNAVYYPEEVRAKAGCVSKDPFSLVLPSDLSEREKEVLLALSEGMSNREISESLFISEETTKSHMRNITQKLGVRDRTAAAIYAIKAGVGRQQTTQLQ